MSRAIIGLLFLSTLGYAGMVRADCSDISPEFISTEAVNNVIVHYRTQPSVLPVGEFFTMDVWICEDHKPWAGALTIDATMPAHGHGMNYQPQLLEVRKGEYKVEGFLFQMPGQWRFDFGLSSGQSSNHVYSFVDVGG